MNTLELWRDNLIVARDDLFRCCTESIDNFPAFWFPDKSKYLGSFREKTELLYVLLNTFIDFGWISVGKKIGHDIVLLYLQTCQTVFAQSLKSLQHETMYFFYDAWYQNNNFDQENERWDNFMNWKLSQHLFLGRIEGTIICFWDCLTFNLSNEYINYDLQIGGDKYTKWLLNAEKMNQN